MFCKNSAQSATIEAQNKKLDDQQRLIEKCSITINEQNKVIEDLSTKINALLDSKCNPKSETETWPKLVRGSETNIVPDDAVSTVATVTERARRAEERAKKNKDAAILHRRQRVKEIENSNAIIDFNNSSNEEEEWKEVTSKKKKSKAYPKVISKGGNMQISSIQAIEKKKFLHVWSLHIDTSEDTIIEHVTKVCDSKDVKVEKIIPKTKRDYSSFMVGVPESKFELINNSENWPLNTRFNEWVWFRNYRNKSENAKNGQ